MNAPNSPAGAAQSPDPKLPKPIAPKHNPFRPGFAPNGKRNGGRGGFATRRGLLRYMLDLELTTQDLPTKMADELRRKWPGLFENVEKKFTWAQILDLTQLQLVLSPSEKVQQQAINAIKDRTEA